MTEQATQPEILTAGSLLVGLEHEIRICRAKVATLMNYMTGVPAWSEHFLTLCDGRTIDVPEGKDAWQVYEPHLLAALGEGLCPWCSSPLNARRECRDARHTPTRWHAGPDCYGQVMLDTHRREPALCSECGGEM